LSGPAHAGAPATDAADVAPPDAGLDRAPENGPPALAAYGVGKRYPLARTRLRSLLERSAPADDGAGLWVLRDVSFALSPGRSLGVIGRNGAGKSTLLRLLSGVARPTTGRVEVRARLACLLDLGVGFHPLETGRENAEATLVLQAGLTRSEARRRIDEVEAFAEIGEFFDRPIRTYSDGMRLRLAFATITVLDPDILITDEILAVGDELFQQRCNAWFDRFLARRGGLVLCSHDLSQIQRLCDRTLWLDGGGARELGDSRDVVRHYREAMGTAAAGSAEEGGEVRYLHALGESTGLAFEVVDLRLEDEQGTALVDLPRDATVVVTVDVHAPVAVPQLCIGITRADLTPVFGVTSDMDGAVPERVAPARYRYRLRLPRLPLTAGQYRLRAHAMDETGTRLYDTVELMFRVAGDDEEEGIVRLATVAGPAPGGEESS
jgi:lipopolysaccharide transport system ATP-binding protein